MTLGIHDLQWQVAVGQACVQPVAWRRVQDAAHDATVGMTQDRVTARHSGERTDGFQRTRQSTQPQRFIAEATHDGRLRSRRHRCQALAQPRDAALRMRRAQDGIGMADTCAFPFQPALPRRCEAAQGVGLAPAQRI